MARWQRKHHFYGETVLPERQQELILNILKKYRGRTVDGALHQEIWDELQMEKHLGRLTIPFKVVKRIDPEGKYPDKIEVILDTKV